MKNKIAVYLLMKVSDYFTNQGINHSFSAHTIKRADVPKGFHEYEKGQSWKAQDYKGVTIFD